MKKCLGVVLFICVLVNMLIIPSSANSVNTKWNGTDAAGTVISSGDCPVEVTKEVLTFDISQTPSVSGHSVIKNFDAKGSKVTAEYTFYNPSDMEITAQLAFPFGSYPDYASEKTEFDITVNGEIIDKSVRHTLRTGRQFNLENDIAGLSDEYISLGFFSPDMLVTAYTYTVVGDPEWEVYKAFDIDATDETRQIYYSTHSLRFLQENGKTRLGERARINRSVTVYVIGEPLSEPLEWKLYSDESLSDDSEVVRDVSIQLTSTETLTFRKLAFKYYEKVNGVSKLDWYNAFICSLRYKADDNNNILYVNYGMDILDNLMCWYQYEITIPSHASIVNTVTAPMYPDVNTASYPPTFTYTYFLSPASKWVYFGELEININTPYYLTSTNIEGFLRTESGYTLTLDGLPDMELEFDLRAEPDFISELKSYIKPIAHIPNNYIKYSMILSVALIAIVGFFVIKRKIS